MTKVKYPDIVGAFMGEAEDVQNSDGTHSWSFSPELDWQKSTSIQPLSLVLHISLAGSKRQRWRAYIARFSPRLTDFVKAYPSIRRVYRQLGSPFGQNDGAFKRWCLTRRPEFWKGIVSP